jgi:hypothetical protein
MRQIRTSGSMSGVWKRKHGGNSEAPTDERVGNPHRVAYATFYTEGFSSFVATDAASVATGWNEPVPARNFSPAEDQRLFTAHSDFTTNSLLKNTYSLQL